MKYAVYVEGQAEMLFVADVLQKYSDYNPSVIGIKCINLVADVYKDLNFPQQGNMDAENYYQIVNVNNDDRIISKLNNDIPNLLNQGFQIVIGLKDVYSKAYEQLCKSPSVNRQIIENLYRIQTCHINTRASDFRLHYGKHEGELLSFLSSLGKEDYERLRHSGRCASFSKFMDSLFGCPKPLLP